MSVSRNDVTAKLYDVKRTCGKWDILQSEGPVLATDFECIRDRWYYNLHKIHKETNTVKGVIGNVEVSPLVDTGASISVIDGSLFRRVFAGQGQVMGRGAECELADGSQVRTEGIWSTKVRLGVVAYPIDLYIWPCVSRGMIIGRDFLREHDMAISYKCKRKQRIYGVRTIRNIVIPPRQRGEIVGMVDRPLKDKIRDGMEAWYEQDPREGLEGVAVARALVTIHSDRIPVQLINYTNSPIRIPEGTKLGAVALGQVTERAEVNSLKGEATDDNFQPQVDLDETGLSTLQKQQVKSLCSRYRDVFVGPSGNLGLTHLVKHKIELKAGAQPIHRMPHRQSPMMREAMEDIIKEQLDQGIIEPCAGSPWASPAFLVAKGSATEGSKKKWRMVVDYRGLNAATVERVLNIPRADDIFDNVGQSHPVFFSCLDLQAGFHQMPIEESDRDKTAFITHSGTFAYRTLPMGMTNSPRSFQLLMDLVLAGASYKHALAYLDDVIIFSNSYESHLSHIEDVFGRLRQAGLKLRASKCVLFRREIKYLGHLLSAQGIAPHADNVEPIKKLKVPDSVAAVRSFLGMVGYYRKFIRNFACRAKPLTNLTREGVPFEWGENEQAAFTDLRDALVGRDVLAYPDFSRPFELTTDACNYGMGAVLAQRDSQNRVRPVAFAAKTFGVTEENYPITEKELCAVVWACNHFRVYLESKRFKLFTDHKALNWMLTTSKLNPKMARWVTTLQGFKFDIAHVKGKENVVADALSRLPAHCQLCDRPLAEILEERAEYRRQRRDRGQKEEVNAAEVADNMIDKLAQHEIGRNAMKWGQLQDRFCLPIIAYLREGILPTCDKEGRKLLLAETDFILEDDLLYRLEKGRGVKHGLRALLVIPKSMTRKIMYNTHEAAFGGHMGADRMAATLRASFYWEGMVKDIIQYCKRCETCNRTKRMTHPIKAPLTIRDPSPRPWAIANMDAMEDLPVTDKGNKHIINVVDYYSRYLISFPVPDLTADTLVEQFHSQVICRVGGIGRLVMDNGSAFISRKFEAFCANMGIGQSFNTALNPKASGLVERTNRSVLGVLRTLSNERQNDWDRYLPTAAAGINMTPVYATGHSPYILLHGVEPIRPAAASVGDPWDTVGSVSDRFADILRTLEGADEAARMALSSTQEKMKARYDRSIFMPDIAPGDIVYLYWPRINKPGRKLKLGKIYHGPMIVLRYNTEKTVFLKRIQDGKILSKPVTVDRLKKALLPHNVEEWEGIQNVEDPPVELDEGDFPFDSFEWRERVDENHDSEAGVTTACRGEEKQVGEGAQGGDTPPPNNIPIRGEQPRAEVKGRPAATKNREGNDIVYHPIRKILDVVKPRGEDTKYKVQFKDEDVLWLPRDNLNQEALDTLLVKWNEEPRETPRLRSMRR